MFEFGDLRFRPVEREDLKLLHVWENDYELMMFSRSRPMNSRSMVQLEQQFEEWMKNERETRFIIELADLKETVGIARVEIWDGCNVRNANVGTYIGKKDLWGKGLGEQITVALLEICFNLLNVERCGASSVEYNHRAHKVLLECGFKKSGAERQSHFVNGKKWDDLYFDILREEYLQLRMDLLKKVLGDRLEEYFRRSDPTGKQ